MKYSKRDLQGAATVIEIEEILNIRFRGELLAVSRTVDGSTSFWGLSVLFCVEPDTRYLEFLNYAIHDAEGITAPITRAENLILDAMDQRLWLPTSTLDVPTFTWA